MTQFFIKLSFVAYSALQAIICSQGHEITGTGEWSWRLAITGLSLAGLHSCFTVVLTKIILGQLHISISYIFFSFLKRRLNCIFISHENKDCSDWITF